ncbi:hypothetical protein DICPUDRAFT_157468 [Dictyostelium purpureum]|uniref:CAP-Gly domain-containing protein n=1 Tax=Dictyostelium purpureum TaxID=5786 RepID=F0ZZ73_DICPU|nr:uncharacterized protein DICPUDRAFT_157468 [Dictyostelium purpureum]EGC30759.1 hypothetical protein DICPUDRAFT_157468 [Dictyostelium purpureum]|eukprot:XP_003292720.1 hypothetical protein DICPUDRAFT_157468 [Dictyostelium purpureum]
MGEPNNTCNKFKIGERIQSDDGYIGTIRYEGSVDGFDGNWYGIEWDDPKRGKHFGTVKGKQYFQCQYNGSGSFMKPEKLVKGKHFLEMLFNKYHHKIENYDDLYVETTKPEVKIPIEMIGMNETRERQKDFKQQKIISASHLLISEIDEYPAIFNYFKTEIKKSNDNNIELPSKTKSLVLNNLFISDFAFLLPICKEIFSNLETLVVSNNSIENISNSSLDVFSKLVSLDLAHNKIKSFNDITAIGFLEHLQELNLNNNQIDSIEFSDINKNQDDSTTTTKLFKNLKILYLSNNNISDWRHVEELDYLQNLEELSFRENPIIDSLLLDAAAIKDQNQQDETNNTKTVTTSTGVKKISVNKNIYLNRLNIIPRISKLTKLNLSHKIMDNLFGDEIEVPTLLSICTQRIKDSLDNIKGLGRIPDKLLIVILDKCPPQQLIAIENKIGRNVDTEELWKRHCFNLSPNQSVSPEDNDVETWRELYVVLERNYLDKARKTGDKLRNTYNNAAKNRQSKQIKVLSEAETPVRARPTYVAKTATYKQSSVSSSNKYSNGTFVNRGERTGSSGSSGGGGGGGGFGNVFKSSPASNQPKLMAKVMKEFKKKK